MELPPFVPPGISPVFAAILVLASFFTSALTAAMGLGGGVAMLAIMGTGMPVANLLPVHGIVQLGSNLGRAVIQRRHILRPMTGWFLLGSVVGIAAGSPVVAWVPEAPAQLLLALFILWSVFSGKPRARPIGGTVGYLTAGGALTSFASMLVGATGPLVAALLAARGLARQPLVATHAACMVIQHGLKIVAFGLLGFAYGAWLPMLAAMIASGVAGTYVGTRVLDRLPERHFRIGFRITMAALAAYMIVGALRQLAA